MKRIVNLGQINWVAGGVQTQTLQPIPDGYHMDSYRVTQFLLFWSFDITTGAGGGYTGEELLRWIRNINLKAHAHNFTNLSGWELFWFNWYLNEIPITLPPNVAANQANDLNYVKLVIPMENPRAISAQDFVVPAAVFNDGSLRVDQGVAVLNANSTINTASLQIWAMVERKNESQIPALPTIGASTHEMFDQIPPGVYDQLFILAPSGDFTAAADITSMRLMAGGEEILQGVAPEATCMGYLQDKLWDWIALGGFSWAEEAATHELVPLIWPGWNPSSNRVSQFIDSRGESVSIDFQGTLTSVDLVYRYYEQITRTTSDRMLAKLGVHQPADLSYKRKTVSKGGLTRAAVLTQPGLSIVPVKITGSRNLASLGRLSSRFLRQLPGSDAVL